MLVRGHVAFGTTIYFVGATVRKAVRPVAKSPHAVAAAVGVFAWTDRRITAEPK